MIDAAPAPTALATDTITTGVDDATYDLVVVLHRTLADCTRHQQVARDARDTGDEELATFFDELALNGHGVAARARHLLAARL